MPRVPFWIKVQTDAYWSHRQQCPACCGGLRSGGRVEPCFVALCVSTSNNRSPAVAETALSAASLPSGRAYPSSSLCSLVGDYKRTRHRRLGLIICASHLPIILRGSLRSQHFAPGSGRLGGDAAALCRRHVAPFACFPTPSPLPFREMPTQVLLCPPSVSTWLT